MNRLFGKKSKEAEPTLDDAVTRVEGRVKTTDERIAKLDAELVKIKEQIKRSSGPAQQRYKQRAVQLLQQKRTYEKQQDTMMAQQFNIDQLKYTMDTVKDTEVQVKSMKLAQKTLAKDMKKINIDKVEDMQAELAELYYDTQEIQDIMGRAYDVPDDIDEMDMMAELDALDDVGVGNDYLAADVGVPLPNHPINVPANEANAEPEAAEPEMVK